MLPQILGEMLSVCAQKRILVFLSSVRCFCPNVFETGLCTNVVNSEISRFIQISSAIFKLLLANRQVSVLKFITVALQHLVCESAKRRERPRVTAYYLCVCVFFFSNKQNRTNGTTLHSQTTHCFLTPHFPSPNPSPAPAKPGGTNEPHSNQHFNCLLREHMTQHHTFKYVQSTEENTTSDT